MIIKTVTGEVIDPDLLRNYFKVLVNHFFKILPIREQGEASLDIYMRSLQVELLGCKGFLPELSTDAGYLTLLSILQYLIDNPDCTVREVKREVFKAINICNKLKAVYSTREVCEDERMEHLSGQD